MVATEKKNGKLQLAASMTFRKMVCINLSDNQSTGKFFK